MKLGDFSRKIILPISYSFIEKTDTYQLRHKDLRKQKFVKASIVKLLANLIKKNQNISFFKNAL